MERIKITTIGEITMDNVGDAYAGYGYDVLFDGLQIPYIPLALILKQQGLLPDGVRIGYAHPDGYLGMIKAICDLSLTDDAFKNHIRDYFCNTRIDDKSGSKVRSLKAGQVFYANVDFAEGQREKLADVLKGITHIGVKKGPADGKVEIELVENVPIRHSSYALNEKCEYSSLDYSIMLLTPACIYAPYGEKSGTYTYIPGGEILNMLGGKWDVKCSNAYISEKGKRLLPIPLCASVVKLDKEQFHYRLASGKDYKRTEQDVGLSGAYSSDVDGSFIRYTTSDIIHITDFDGRMYDALSAGQVFSGSIYGSDADIREIAEFLTDNPNVGIGDMTLEGYGESYVLLNRVNAKEIKTQELSKCFEIRCLSDTMIINDEGMATCRAEDLLNEIEYYLKVEGRLEIVGKYTDIANDFSNEPLSGLVRNVTRMYSKGSVIRVKTKDDEPVDIYPIRHCFIGERTREGYGEIAAYPARETYYRIAAKNESAKYDMDYALPIRDRAIGADASENILIEALKSSIIFMAQLDYPTYQGQAISDEDIPTEILGLIRDRQAPQIDDDTLKEWYREGLKEQ